MKKTLVLTVVMVLALGVLAACGDSRKASGSAVETRTTSSRKTTFYTADEVKRPDVICIGMFTDKAPFGYVDANGVSQGYDVVYTQCTAQDLGVKVEFTSLDPTMRTEYVNTGKVGITLAGFTVMRERAEQAGFAKPHMKVALDVVSPERMVIHSVDELRGKTLIIARGTVAEIYPEKDYPEVRLQKYDIHTNVYNTLFDGRGDMFLTGNAEVIVWAKANPDLEVGIDSLGNYDAIAAAVAKNNETLLNPLNEETMTLGKESSSHKDYDETLKPVFGDTANPDMIVVEGGKLGDTKQQGGITKRGDAIAALQLRFFSLRFARVHDLKTARGYAIFFLLLGNLTQ